MRYKQESIIDTLSISEALRVSIICENEYAKDLYLELANFFKYDIPEPITILEYLDMDYDNLDVIVGDDMALSKFIMDLLFAHKVSEKANKTKITKTEALYLLGFNPDEYEIVDD